MKETFTEEEYQEISKLYSREVLKNYYENKENYIGFEGYENLNDYNLLPEDFELLWKCQEILSMRNDKYSLFFAQIEDAYKRCCNELLNERKGE